MILGTAAIDAMKVGTGSVSKVYLGTEQVWPRGFSVLGLSPSLWLDASDATTLFDATSGGSLVGSDGAIARWQDKSGSGNHATQSTSGNRPIRKISNQNGLDAVRFAGSGDEMALPNFLSGAGGTVLFVGKSDGDPNGDPNTGAPIGGWSGDGSSNHVPFSDGNIYFSYGTNSRRTVGNPSRGINLWNVYLVEATGSLWRFRINGTDIYSDGSNTVVWGSAPVIGAGATTFRFWLGEIGEIINIPRAVTTDERTALEGYATSKWGIA